MKIFFTLILLIVVLNIKGQSKYSGLYCDHFGNCITIYSDSTFNFKSSWNLLRSWSNGKWTVKLDTMYFTFIPVYDTFVFVEEKYPYRKIALSEDPKSESVYIHNIDNTILGTGGLCQNRIRVPEKLFYKNDKFFYFEENGKLARKKIVHYQTGKKYHPWLSKNK